MSMFKLLGKATQDLYKCDWCRRTVQRKDTLIISNKKGQFRLCRDCQFKNYMKELKEANPGTDVQLKVEQFSKDIKDGK